MEPGELRMMERVRALTDGHLTVCAFTTGWKASCRTISPGEYGEWLRGVNYPTLELALFEAMVEWAGEGAATEHVPQHRNRADR